MNLFFWDFLVLKREIVMEMQSVWINRKFPKKKYRAKFEVASLQGQREIGDNSLSLAYYPSSYIYTRVVALTIVTNSRSGPLTIVRTTCHFLLTTRPNNYLLEPHATLPKLPYSSFLKPFTLLYFPFLPLLIPKLPS